MLGAAGTGTEPRASEEAAGRAAGPAVHGAAASAALALHAHGVRHAHVCAAAHGRALG